MTPIVSRFRVFVGEDAGLFSPAAKPKKRVRFGGPEFASRVKAIRRAAGMSQKQFAAALRVKFCTVNRWENGHHPPLARHLKTVEEFAILQTCVECGSDIPAAGSQRRGEYMAKAAR